MEQSVKAAGAKALGPALRAAGWFFEGRTRTRHFIHLYASSHVLATEEPPSLTSLASSHVLTTEEPAPVCGAL